MSLIRLSAGVYLDPWTRQRVEPVAEVQLPPVVAPVERRRAPDPAPPPSASGPIALTSKGMLHRVQIDGRLHPRCSGGQVVTYRVIDGSEAVGLAAGATWRLCRYAWCFREWVESVGIDPEVGHVSRVRRAPGPVPGARCDRLTTREGLPCGRVEGHAGYCRPEGRL